MKRTILFCFTFLLMLQSWSAIAAPEDEQQQANVIQCHADCMKADMPIKSQLSSDQIKALCKNLCSSCIKKDSCAQLGQIDCVDNHAKQVQQELDKCRHFATAAFENQELTAFQYNAAINSCNNKHTYTDKCISAQEQATQRMNECYKNDKVVFNNCAKVFLTNARDIGMGINASPSVLYEFGIDNEPSSGSNDPPVFYGVDAGIHFMLKY